jgi:hypothetical protein
MQPSGAGFDGAFSFGQSSGYAGVVENTTTGSETKRLKVYVGGTLMYMPLCEAT